MLGYTNGGVYLTVTYYQRWDKNGNVYTIGDKETGANSAWFYFDFTS